MSVQRGNVSSFSTRASRSRSLKVVVIVVAVVVVVILCTNSKICISNQMAHLQYSSVVQISTVKQC